MVGRFGGSVVLRRASAARTLAVAAFAAAGPSLSATTLTGRAVALLSGGGNRIMYPTIYALALPRDEHEALLGSMLLRMAMVGEAVMPVATGLLSDRVGLVAAFGLAALCYLGIAGFAWSCFWRPQAVESRA